MKDSQKADERRRAAEAPVPPVTDDEASGAGAGPRRERAPQEVAAADAAAEPPALEEEPDFKDRWLRAEAELKNFRRRSQRDLEESVRFAEERVLLEIISLLDDLERALDAAAEAGAAETWMQGVRLVARRMGEYLSRQGVTVVDPLGQPFDPEFHEAMLEVDAPGRARPGDVVQVVRKGYRRNGRALRAARVVVARRPAADES